MCVCEVGGGHQVHDKEKEKVRHKASSPYHDHNIRLHIGIQSAWFDPGS